MNTAKPHLAVIQGQRLSTNLAPEKRLRIRIDLGPKPSPPAPLKIRRELQAFEFGNIRIPYAPYPANGKPRYWMLFYKDGNRRRRESRVKFSKAKARAQQIAIDIQNGQTSMAQFTEDQRAHYKLLLELASKAGAPAELLISEAADARRKASMAKFVYKTCREIVDELLAAKRAEDAGVRWIDDLESRLDRFEKDFKCPLANITESDIRTWLTRLNLSKRSSNNYRTALLTMVTFARDRKYIGPDWEAMVTIKPFRLVKPVEEIYTPEEICSLLFTAEKCYPQHLPTLAIMAFAGCRHCELQDAGEILDWKDVHFKTAKIHISESVAKSNTGRRYVPMQPNLVAWIQTYAKLRGPVCEVGNLTNALRRIAARAKVPFKRNGLRNSFISYRCAATQNVPQVASEAGNSVGEIHKSYRRELTQEEGLRWFEIMPTRADELPLFAHAGL
jgi:integrase